MKKKIVGSERVHFQMCVLYQLHHTFVRKHGVHVDCLSNRFGSCQSSRYGFNIFFPLSRTEFNILSVQ